MRNYGQILRGIANGITISQNRMCKV